MSRYVRAPAEPWAMSGEELMAVLEVNESGLASEDAARRGEQFGLNELPPQEGTPFWTLVYKQFEDQMVIMLLVAAAISFVLALFEDSEDQLTAFVEPVVILLILIANAIVGVVQESNAEKAIEALKEYEASEATVLRDGALQMLPSSALVPGDIIHLRVGGKVPADCRVLSVDSSAISVNQALLTGESAAVGKTVAPLKLDMPQVQDKVNMLFSGTLITRGRCRAVVVATGRSTEMGNIMSILSEEESVRTPLQRTLDEFGEQLSKLIMVVCILVWLINIGNFTDPSHGGLVRGAIYYFKIAVSLAVAAIPEGLPAVVTTCLALGTAKMAKKNAIVRSLPSVETLGCTTVICSDKTGTLTTSKMAVQRVVVVDSVPDGGRPAMLRFSLDSNDYSPTGVVRLESSAEALRHPAAEFPALADVALVCSVCSESNLEYGPDGYGKLGDATEAALLALSEKLGMPDDMADEERLACQDPHRLASWCTSHWRDAHSTDFVMEFNRDRKSMGVVVSPAAGRRLLLVKGAPESVLARCSRVRLNSGGTKPLNDVLREALMAQVDDMGRSAYRTLAMAFVENPNEYGDFDYTDPEHFAKIEDRMTFVGMAGMIDPPKEEVKSALKACKDAGIRVMVLTGDNPATAEAICRRIGVLPERGDVTALAYTGRDLEEMSAIERQEAVARACLFSRVAPVHKKQIVDLLHEQREVVAMTGDGVNDAPALRKADIGVAMGSGTAVAKEASDMVLADDDFGTIVLAVEEGRAIYNNTKQFIRYLVSSNIGEVVCIFITAALGIPEALIPVQLLWVNFVTDGLPATALSFNPPDSDIMRVGPRSPSAPVVSSWLFFRYLIVGLYVGVAVVLGFVWWFLYYPGGPQMTYHELATFHACTTNCEIFKTGMARPSTVALSILVCIEMFNALNSLSENQSLFRMPPWKNMWLIAAILLSIGLHAAILYIPFFAGIFNVAPLTVDEWLAVIWFSLPVILIDEVVKYASRHMLANGTLQGAKSTEDVPSVETFEEDMHSLKVA